jgi:hypothetical protein
MSAHFGHILTFWLLPAEPARTHFQKMIRDLAKRFDAPLFEPHLTIYVTSPQNENAIDLLRRALTGAKPFQLIIEQLEFSEKFTETLFLRFRHDTALCALATKFQALSVSQREYKVNPHLSLMYKTMPDAAKAKLAGSIRLPFEKVLFDSARSVISPARITSREHVEAWRVAACEKISG